MRGLWTILPVLGALAVGAGSAWAAETPQAAPTYQAQAYQSPEDQPFWTRSPSTPAGVVLPLVAGTAPLAWSNEYFEHGRAFRLIGIGASELTDPAQADPLDLADPDSGKRAKVERAIDAVRAKLGKDILKKGRGWH